MKVLHIVAGELNGGAARGAYWLHLGLQKLGVNSNILTSSKTTLGDNDVISLSCSTKDKVLKLLRHKLDSLPELFYKKRERILFSTGLFGFDFTKTTAYKEADVIHLHWINEGFVNIKHLRKVDKPIIWTMRDMWPMTGGCHVAESLDCDYYKNGCGKCKQLGSTLPRDLSSFVVKRKRKYLPSSMKIIGISNWIANKARESFLFKNFDVRTIHNNVDVTNFFPINKKYAKEAWGITTDKKVILLGSTNISDPWKGFQKYLGAIKTLDCSKYFLCFFGIVDESIVKKLGFEYRSFGVLSDGISLRLAYNCADIFVAPSLLDSFGKTIAESMACKTPVVCFDATGPRDIVTHKVDGFKAQPFSSEDLAQGIEWLASIANYDVICENARNKVLEEFDSAVIAKKYLALYEEVLHD